MSYGWTAIFVEPGVEPNVMGSIREKWMGDFIKANRPDVDMGGKRWRWHSFGGHHVMFTLQQRSRDDAPTRPVLAMHMADDDNIGARPHGYYWVAPKGENWEVALYKLSYHGTGWYRSGLEGAQPDDIFRKIGDRVERHITTLSAQQVV